MNAPSSLVEQNSSALQKNNENLINADYGLTNDKYC